MSWNIFTTITACIILALFLAFFLSKSLADSERLSTKNDVTYSNLAQSMEKIMIAHAQVLGLMSSFPLQWPAFLRQFFWMFGLFSDPVPHLFNPACYNVDTEISLVMLKQALILCLPFMLIVPITLFWWGRWKCASVSDAESYAERVGRIRVARNKKVRSDSLDRTALVKLFEQADRLGRGTITSRQFVRLTLQHGDVMGHDWKPRHMKILFHQPKHKKQHGLTLAGFLAGVMHHAHERRTMAQKLRKANAEVDMIEHHDGSKRGAEKITPLDKWINTVISLFYMMYPSLCVATFSLVGCHRVGKCNAYLQRDLEVQCWTKKHALWVGLVFAPGFLGYVVGLPLSSWWVLHRKRFELHQNRRTKFQLSILCVGYRPSMEHWEAVVSLRKGLVVGISIFILGAGPKLQTLAAQVLIGMLLVLQTNYNPYVKVATRHNPLNNGEMLGLGTLFLTLATGMYLHHYRETEATGMVGREDMFTISASVLIIMVNVAFFVLTVRWYTVIYLVDVEMELERSAKKSVGNTYLAFCLQYFLPDWREESHIDIIQDDKAHKRRIAQLMSVDRMMRLQGFAQRWVHRTRERIDYRAATAIQRENAVSRRELAGRTDRKLRRAHTKVMARVRSRIELAAAAAASSSVSDTHTHVR
jgi:hypothetical protein